MEEIVTGIGLAVFSRCLYGGGGDCPSKCGNRRVVGQLSVCFVGDSC